MEYAFTLIIGLAFGALTFYAGVRQGMKMSRMIYNAKEGYDPLYEPKKPKPVDPNKPVEETV